MLYSGRLEPLEPSKSTTVEVMDSRAIECSNLQMLSSPLSNPPLELTNLRMLSHSPLQPSSRTHEPLNTLEFEQASSYRFVFFLQIRLLLAGSASSYRFIFLLQTRLPLADSASSRRLGFFLQIRLPLRDSASYRLMRLLMGSDRD